MIWRRQAQLCAVRVVVFLGVGHMYGAEMNEDMEDDMEEAMLVANYKFSFRQHQDISSSRATTSPPASCGHSIVGGIISVVPV